MYNRKPLYRELRVARVGHHRLVSVTDAIVWVWSMSPAESPTTARRVAKHSLGQNSFGFVCFRFRMSPRGRDLVPWVQQVTKSTSGVKVDLVTFCVFAGFVFPRWLVSVLGRGGWSDLADEGWGPRLFGGISICFPTLRSSCVQIYVPVVF